MSWYQLEVDGLFLLFRKEFMLFDSCGPGITEQTMMLSYFVPNITG